MEEDNVPVPLEPDDIVTGLMNTVSDDSAAKDFEIARANLHRLAEQGTAAVELAAQVAEQSQHPNAYLALARMIETVTQTQKELLELQKSIRAIQAASSSINGKTNNITQNLFVGSTAALQRMLEDIKKREIASGN